MGRGMRGTGRRSIRNKGIQAGFEIRGIEEVAHVLDTIIPREANNLLRSTTNGIAGRIRDKAQANARTLGFQSISKAIKSRRKNSPPEKPIAVVFVEKGQGAKSDAWYWHFFEFGTDIRFVKSGPYAGRIVGRIPERPFIRPARDAILAKLPEVIREEFQKKLTKRIAAVQKKLRATK